MAASSKVAAGAAISHSAAFRRRRFLNWFPLGVTYALLYMGRYNLTVAKNSLGELMTKEDFGIIFGAGTFVYAFAFLLNGPLVDRMGGRKGMLVGALGAMVANLAMGAYLYQVLGSGHGADAPLRLVLSLLYAVNMYFQSFGAVSIVKVNAHWFHVTERGGFSGIFGTMISSGIFLAFTVNDVLLRIAQRVTGGDGQHVAWVVFALPGLFLGLFFLIELFLLRDRPSQAGHEDFDTGDASSGESDETPIPALQLIRRILTNPIILTVACIEFCTGVLRNGVMHWFPIYAKEIWALPSAHPLRGGAMLTAIDKWTMAPLSLALPCFVVAAISGAIASKASGARRGYLIIFSALAFLAPFLVQGGWGGLLMVAGVVGGNVAGWVSDLFFQSRRGPAAAGLYGFLALCTLAMAFVLAPGERTVASAADKSGLLPGDTILAIGDNQQVGSWKDVRDAVVCWQPTCRESGWDAKRCICASDRASQAKPDFPEGRPIPARVERDGKTLELSLKDPSPNQRAGDMRLLKAQPVTPLSPYYLGFFVFMMSLCVIGTHGLLSGTATMDFGGRRGAATAVGVIDGFVYLGTALQSVSLGYLTSRDWSYWPWFLLPFAVIGFALCLKIWSAKPGKAGAH
ncbi:MAG: MFS transporter [Polyangiaceae bacterium]